MGENSEKSFVERFGDSYFNRLSKKKGRIVEEDEVYILNPDEQEALRKTEMGVVRRAALAGATSGLLCAILVLISWPLLGQDPDHPSNKNWLIYFVVVNVGSILISFAEIWWLYYDALRSVHHLSIIAGLDFYSRSGEVNIVRESLIRAALDLPNPRDGEVGIDPLRETSKIKLFFVSIAYKLKVTASSIVFKAIIGRIGGRVIARKYIDFFGLPVYAAWDALTLRRVMREARIRAMGPSAIEVMLNSAMADLELSGNCKISLLMAAGASVVATADLHPNHINLLNSLFRRTGLPHDMRLDDSKAFLDSLHLLNGEEQKMVLQVFGIAIAIDGRLAPKEKELYLEARAICKLNENLSYPVNLRKLFRSGQSAHLFKFE